MITIKIRNQIGIQNIEILQNPSGVFAREKSEYVKGVARERVLILDSDS